MFLQSLRKEVFLLTNMFNFYCTAFQDSKIPNHILASFKIIHTCNQTWSVVCRNLDDAVVVVIVFLNIEINDMKDWGGEVNDIIGLAGLWDVVWFDF